MASLPESEQEEIWNAFYDKYGCEPKDSTILQKFIKWDEDLKEKKITYKTIRQIHTKYKGKGRIREKTETTSSDIIKALPTKKARQAAEDQNILKLVSIFKLQFLIDGYIRNMNENDETFLYIIPAIISHLCLNYCTLPNFVVLIDTSKNIQVADLISQNVWNCKLQKLHNKYTPHSYTNGKRSWPISAVTFSKYVKLPSQIVEKYKQPTADIIFQQQKNYCNAILFDLNQIHYDSVDGYQYDLPLNTTGGRDFIGNSLVFHENIGLISVGGGFQKTPYSKNVHRLPWKEVTDNDDDNNQEWKWETLPSLLFARGEASTQYIGNNKFMVIAGATTVIDNENRNGGRYGYNNGTLKGYITQCVKSVELYDMEKKTSSLASSVNHPRFCAGSCYDENQKRIYLGGGISNGNYGNSVECYDTEKDKWYVSIPRTSKHHTHFPILWTQNNGDLLFIASLESKVVEFIDLRVYGAKWNIMLNDDGNNDSLLSVFRTGYGSSRRYRLLK